MSNPSFVACPRCKKWGWAGEHRCDPVWEAQCADIHNFADEDDHWKVYAKDAESAAEAALEAAEADGESRYDTIVKVRVRAVGLSIWQTFQVFGYDVRSYSAEEVKEDA